jgi:radical SAM superfamily enzyme YgiQ (UPF0313 family)
LGRTELLTALRSRLDDEDGTIFKTATHRVALVYPSPYRVAMSSLGYQTVYRQLNEYPDVACERSMLPDDVEAHRAARLGLVTLESQEPVGSFDTIALSVAYELELPGLFETLSLANIPALTAERDHRHPLVLAGGPLTFSNPVPLAPFVDAVLLGEAESALDEFVEVLRSTTSRRERLEALATKQGYWVPALHGDSAPLPGIAKAADERLPATSAIRTPHTELADMFLIEPERGCSRGCTYCVMRRSTNGGMRLASPERVAGLIPAAARKVGLVGAAVTDHPRIVDIVRHIVDSGRNVGISSLRADRLTLELVELLGRGGYRTLTVASDGASQRLRASIDRKTQERHLLAAAAHARTCKLRTLKVYMMVGLPEETEEDIDELVSFSTELSKIIPTALGIAPFVAKRNTPLDGAPFEPIASVEAKLARLRAGLRGRVDVRPTSPRWAWVEYMLAQGDAAAGMAAYDAWRAGGSFAAWKRAFGERGAQPRGARAAQAAAPQRPEPPSGRPSVGTLLAIRTPAAQASSDARPNPPAAPPLALPIAVT